MRFNSIWIGNLIFRVIPNYLLKKTFLNFQKTFSDNATPLTQIMGESKKSSDGFFSLITALEGGRSARDTLL